MSMSSSAEVQALRAAAEMATQAREDAQQCIVLAFRAQLQALGPGPADADLRRFARLVQVERALQWEFGCALALAVLALVSVADLRTQALYRAGYHGLTVHLGTGAYIGGAAAVVALLSAAWVSHDEIVEPGHDDSTPVVVIRPIELPV